MWDKHLLRIIKKLRFTVTDPYLKKTLFKHRWNILYTDTLLLLVSCIHPISSLPESFYSIKYCTHLVKSFDLFRILAALLFKIFNSP